MQQNDRIQTYIIAGHSEIKIKCLKGEKNQNSELTYTSAQDGEEFYIKYVNVLTGTIDVMDDYLQNSGKYKTGLIEIDAKSILMNNSNVEKSLRNIPENSRD